MVKPLFKGARDALVVKVARDALVVKVARDARVVKVARDARVSKAARDALVSTDWGRIDAMTDENIARQIATNRDAAPDQAPEIDVRAIRRGTGMTQAQFSDVYDFSLRTVQEWERGAKKPSGPARTLLRAIKADPEGLRKALAAA